MKANYLFVLALALITQWASGQNLVPNPSMEDTVFCPTGNSQMTAVQFWQKPNTGSAGTGTSDYYNQCDFQSGPAHTGDGHCGMISYIDFIPNAREYIQVQLTQPLVAGECYETEMWVKLQPGSAYEMTDFAMVFTDTAPEAPGGTIILTTPQVSNSMIIDTVWTLITGGFTAVGGEEWLTIGVFVDDASVGTIQPTGSPGLGANLFVDDVVVQPVQTDTFALNTLTDSTTCGSIPLTFNAPGGYGTNYNWYDITNPGTSLSSTNTLNVSPGATTTYVLMITDVCADTYSDTVTVTINPPFNITNETSTNITACSMQDGTITISTDVPAGGLQFSIDGGTNYFSNSGSFTGLAAGTYDIFVTDGSCTVQGGSIPITSPGQPAAPTITGTTAYCDGNPISPLNVVGTGGTYTWYSDAGLTNVLGTGQNYTPGSGVGSVTFYITETVSGCESLPVSVTITINELATAMVSADTSICLGDNATLTGSSNTSFTWNTGPSTASITVAPLADTYYWITATNGCGSAFDSVLVTVVPPPAVALGPDVTINIGEETQLNAGSGNGYLWTPSADLSCNTCGSPIASPLSTTTYTVEVTNSLGCRSMDSITVWVDDSSNPMWIANIFSPNGDGANDVLYVRGGPFSHISLSIFDRWGQKVFESADQDNGWDGTIQGDKAMEGVYVYTITATQFNGTQIQDQGNITLIR